MKNIIICLASILFSNFLYSQDNSFSLTGKIENRYDDQYIMLFTFKNNNILSVDTATIRNGGFSFKGKEYIDDFSLLSVGNYPDTVIWAELILGKGHIEINMGKPSVVKGSYLNNEFRNYKDSSNYFWKKIQDSNALVDTDSISTRENSEIRISNMNNYINHKYFFMKKHINNILGQYVFSKEALIITDSMYMDIFNLLDDDVKKNPQIREMISFKDKYKRRQKLVNKKYTDFELLDTKGNKRKISDYVGKSQYLLIDFWASWCGPCIADMPYLKTTYLKYKDKGLNVLAISLDDGKNQWLKAIKRIDVPWDHLCDFKGLDSDLTNTYHIKGIPNAILLDKNGIIQGVNLRGESLDGFLKNKLGEPSVGSGYK